MQSRIYRFEIVRALANAVFEAHDLTTGHSAVLYEWTPAAADREAAKARLEALAPALQAEVFTADASLYLAAPTQALAREPLQTLRANGLFTGTWLGDPQPALPAAPAAAAAPTRQPAKRRSPVASFLLLALGLAAGALLGTSLWPAPKPNCPVPIVDNTASQALSEDNQRLQARLKEQQSTVANRQNDLQSLAGTHLLRVKNTCSTAVRAAAQYTGFNGQKAVQGWTSIAPGTTGVVAASPSPDFLLYAVSPTGQAWGNSDQTLDVLTSNFLYTLTDGLADESKTQVNTLVVHFTALSDVISLTCEA